MPTTLTARERTSLKGRAHALEPVVHAGSSGVTDTLVAEVDRALTAHELIKVTVNTADRTERLDPNSASLVMWWRRQNEATASRSIEIWGLMVARTWYRLGGPFRFRRSSAYLRAASG